MPSISARFKQVFVSLTGTAFKQACVFCQQAWAVYSDSKGLYASCEVKNATYVHIHIHVHTSALTRRVKLPGFFLQSNWQAMHLPPRTHPYPFGVFRTQFLSLSTSNEYSSQALFSQPCTKTGLVLLAALPCSEDQTSSITSILWCCLEKGHAPLQQWRNPREGSEAKGITAIMHCSGDYQREKSSFQTRRKTPHYFETSLWQLWMSGNSAHISEAG